MMSVITLAVALRVWNVDIGLPYLYHPDEPRYIGGAQTLFKTLDLNPRALTDISPGAFVYVVNAIAYVPYFVGGNLLGVFHGVADIPPPTVLNMGVARTTLSTTILLGRYVSIGFGVGSVLLVYLIGRRLITAAAAGIVAALMLAVSPDAVYHSRLVTPDTFVVFFVLLTFLGAGGILKYFRRRDYALVGIALGCLASAKISGLVVVIPVLMALLQRKGWRSILNRRMMGLFAAGAIAYVVTTPYVLVDPIKVVSDNLNEVRHYADGHPGMEGETLAYYIGYLWRSDGFVCALMIVEILRGLLRKSIQVVFLALFPISYFILISIFVVRNDRTLLPIMPFMYVLAASCLVNVSTTLMADRRTKLGIATFLAVVGVTTCISLASTISMTESSAALIGSREAARVWIQGNLPLGSRIVFEAYSPYVDPQRFELWPVGRIIDHSRAWYLDKRIRYVIVSEGMFGRYFADRNQYAFEVLQYEAFFRESELVARFNDGGYEIRIVALNR